jgi:hypothetical protein
LTKPLKSKLAGILAVGLTTFPLWCANPATVFAGAAEGSAPFINTWALLGPFDNDANAGYDTDFIGETSITPRIGDAAAGKTWVYFDDRLFSRNMDDYIDLYSYYKVRLAQDPQWKATYLHTYVYSPSALAAQLRIGSNDGFKAWFNGTQVGSYSDRRGALKDDSVLGITLVPGWNRVLLKVCNQTVVYGCYVRISDSNGDAVAGLQYSVNGGDGPLAVATEGMSGTAAMPNGYKEWSYISLQTAGTHINSAQASHFYLQAQGGTPPYAWSTYSGALPSYLNLDSNGKIHGKCSAVGSYDFVVKVTDNNGASATKPLEIVVAEPPTRSYLESNFSSLCHWPGHTHIDGGESREIPDLDNVPSEAVYQMKREGYQYVIPQACADPAPHWPAPGHEDVNDWVTPFYEAAEANGLKFGLYYSIYNGYHTTEAYAEPVDHTVGDIADAIVRYDPAVFWFDEIGRDANKVFHTAEDTTANMEYDALHSFIKASNPSAVVLMNDGFGPSRMARGDIDVLELEGSRSDWVHWPSPPGPDDKKMPVESWRNPNDRAWPGLTWQDAVQQVVSLIGEGYIANLDHSPVSNMPGLHYAVEDWMTPPSPPARPPRWPSLSNTRFLSPKEWGYARINLAGDKIYLHILSNPRGRTGMPAGGSLEYGPVNRIVSGVRVLNDDTPLSFTQDGTDLTIDINSVTVDPVDTIIEIALCTELFCDLKILAADWLKTDGYVFLPEPGLAEAHYRFDEGSGNDVNDSSGNGHHGWAVNGDCIWDPDGKYGYCLDFQSQFGVEIPAAALANVNEAVTISVWVNGHVPASDAYDNVIFQAGAGPNGNQPYIITIRTMWWDNGYVSWRTGYNQPDTLNYNATFDEWAEKWNHYAFVKDASTGIMSIYVNGEAVAERTGVFATMAGVEKARIGMAPDRDGDQQPSRMDELRIYSYALSPDEVRYLATGGGYLALVSPANLYDEEPPGSKVVNLRDYAVLAGGR